MASILQIRKCSQCSGTETYVNPKGSQVWHHHSVTSDLICDRCYHRLFSNPITHAKWNSKRFRFKDKQLHNQVVSNCKTGICSRCSKSIASGQIKRTNLHHSLYDEANPSSNLIELCVPCHREVHPGIWGKGIRQIKSIKLTRY